MDYVTVKLHVDTRRLLRLIAAATGEQMIQVMQRLCEGEWDRLQGRTTPDTTPDGSGVQKSDAPFEASPSQVPGTGDDPVTSCFSDTRQEIKQSDNSAVERGELPFVRQT